MSDTRTNEELAAVVKRGYGAVPTHLWLDSIAALAELLRRLTESENTVVAWIATVGESQGEANAAVRRAEAAEAAVSRLVEAASDVLGMNGKADCWCGGCGTPLNARKRLRTTVESVQRGEGS